MRAWRRRYLARMAEWGAASRAGGLERASEITCLVRAWRRAGAAGGGGVGGGGGEARVLGGGRGLGRAVGGRVLGEAERDFLRGQGGEVGEAVGGERVGRGGRGRRRRASLPDVLVGDGRGRP